MSYDYAYAGTVGWYGRFIDRARLKTPRLYDEFPHERYAAAEKFVARIWGPGDRGPFYSAVVAAVIIHEAEQGIDYGDDAVVAIEQMTMALDKLAEDSSLSKADKFKVFTAIKLNVSRLLKGLRAPPIKRQYPDLSEIPSYTGQPVMKFFQDHYKRYVERGLEPRDVLKHDERFYNALGVHCNRKLKMSMKDYFAKFSN